MEAENKSMLYFDIKNRSHIQEWSFCFAMASLSLNDGCESEYSRTSYGKYSHLTLVLLFCLRLLHNEAEMGST